MKRHERATMVVGSLLGTTGAIVWSTLGEVWPALACLACSLGCAFVVWWDDRGGETDG
jgi:hypothetical protein